MKVDCVFLSRSPLAPPAARPCAVRPDARIVTFCDAELAGGKTKALFDRVKVRDLYDICNLKRVLTSTDKENELLAHRAILYYASLSARFPQPLIGRTERFADREAKLESQLIPMQSRTRQSPTI